MSKIIDSTRYKVTCFGNSRQGVITGLPDHLIGRWVALVAADDDCHLATQTQLVDKITDDEISLFQFRATDGSWKNFLDKQHYLDTKASGLWLIRQLAEFVNPTQLAATKEWVDLKDVDIYAISNEFEEVCQLHPHPYIDIDYARAIEAKLKELNT